MKWPISRWSYNFLFCLITAASVLLSAEEANAGGFVNTTHNLYVTDNKIMVKNNTGQVLKLHYMLNGQRKGEIKTLTLNDKGHKMYSDREGMFGIIQNVWFFHHNS